MELLFGTHVRELGYRIGRLAGLEVERGTHEVRKIFFSANGQMGPQTETRPLAAVPVDHFTGDIALSAFPRSTDLPTLTPCSSAGRHASFGAVIRSARCQALRCRLPA